MSRHRYLYGNANPVSNIDPSGMFTLTDAGAAFQILSSLAAASFVQRAFAATINATVGGDPVRWKGFQVGGTLSGLAPGFSGLGTMVVAESNCVFNPRQKRHQSRKGHWIVIGPFFNLLSRIPHAPRLPASVSAGFFGAISPGFMGANEWALAGTYSAAAATITTLLGITGSAFIMGFGYGVADSLTNVLKGAVGIRYGLGFASGLSIPLTWLGEDTDCDPKIDSKK